MAQPSWAPARKKGESESDYKKRYYTAQRKAAEKNKSGSTYKALQKKGYEPAEKSASPAKKRMAESAKPAKMKAYAGSSDQGGQASAALSKMMSGINKGQGKGGSSERKGMMSVIPSPSNKPQANMFSLPKYKGKGEDPAHNRDTYSRMSVLPSPNAKMSDSAPAKKKKSAS